MLSPHAPAGIVTFSFSKIAIGSSRSLGASGAVRGSARSARFSSPAFAGFCGLAGLDLLEQLFLAAQLLLDLVLEHLAALGLLLDLALDLLFALLLLAVGIARRRRRLHRRGSGRTRRAAARVR